MKITVLQMRMLLIVTALALASSAVRNVNAQQAQAAPEAQAAPAAPEAFGPSNPFYAPSALPFHAPPFDKIKDADYQPAMEAGIAEQLKEVQAIAENPAPPTFENTIVALEKSGQLYNRVNFVFNGVTGANTDPALQKVQEIEAPKQAALQDAIYLNAKLFERVKTIYEKRASLKLDPESLRLVEFDYKLFVHTLSPYFSPNSAIAPNSCTATSIGTSTSVTTGVFANTCAFTMLSISANSSSATPAKWLKSNLNRDRSFNDPACFT